MNILPEHSRDSKLPVLPTMAALSVWCGILQRELHKMGHRVTLLAAPGSECSFADVVHHRQRRADCRTDSAGHVYILHCQNFVEGERGRLPPCRDDAWQHPGSEARQEHGVVVATMLSGMEAKVMSITEWIGTIMER